MIKSFTDANLTELEKKFIAAIEGVAHSEGVSVNFAGGSFSAGGATLKLKLELLSPGEGVLTIEQSTYDSRRQRFGLPARGTVITARGGNKFEIKGWKTRAKKYSIMIQNVATGENRVCNPEFVKACQY